MLPDGPSLTTRSYVLEIVSNSHGYLLTNVEFKPVPSGQEFSSLATFSFSCWTSSFISLENYELLFGIYLSTEGYRWLSPGDISSFHSASINIIFILENMFSNNSFVYLSNLIFTYLSILYIKPMELYFYQEFTCWLDRYLVSTYRS